MIQPQPVPDSVVDPNGNVAFGVFDAPFRNINLDEAKLPWGRRHLPAPLARFRLKEWQHFGIIHPDIFAGFAIVDSKFLRLSWCHVLDRVGGSHFEHKRSGPILDIRIARELWNDVTHIRDRDYRIEIDNRLDSGEHRIRIDIGASRAGPAVQAELRCLHDLSRIKPLVVVLPVGKNRGMYSHKVALPAEGTIRIDGRRLELDTKQTAVVVDIHKAHYPRHTFWNWATFAGFDEGGHLIAINLTRNVNRDDERFNENAVWVDGVLHHLGPVTFDLDRARILNPWRVRTKDGAVDLKFTPMGERSENLRLVLARSVFHQPYGTFSGTIRLGDTSLAIERYFGVCEDHDTIW